MELFSGNGRKGWSVRAGYLDPFPANRGFRAPVGCQRSRSRTQAGTSNTQHPTSRTGPELRTSNLEQPGPGYGHPEATPGRRGRLPARAPLRTVRESFPSYGSSPHKEGHFLSCPAVQPLANRGRAAWQYRPAAALHCAPLRQQLQDAPTDWRRSSFAFLG